MFFTLLSKDIILELRTRAAITFIISLSIVLSVILAFGINSAFIDPDQTKKLFPAVIWIVFFLTSTIVLSKSYDTELENRALDALKLAAVSPSLIYLSKMTLNLLLSLCGHVVSVITLALLLNVEVEFIKLLFLSVLVILAFSALTTMTVYISSTSKAKTLLLPVILLPLMLPTYLAALELSYEIFITGQFDLSSAWLSLLLSVDVIYVVLGLNLFPYLIGPE